MTYIVKDECIKCKLMDCVEVCPVDCFYEGENMLVISPEECIDCGVCEPECPVDAIVSDTNYEKDDKQKWLEINEKYSKLWPNISVKKDPPKDADKFKNVKNKLDKYFSEKTRGVIVPKKIKKKRKVKQKLEKSKDHKKVVTTKKINIADQKIEIKKIKKQPTEKKQYNVNDYVVYPKHGVGKITAVEKATIGDIGINFYKILIERDKLTLTIPINQQNHLRPISSINQINKCVSILKTKPKIKRTMWSRRAQEYEQKINSGKIYELAEVVKDLNKTSNTIADQSYSERQLFEQAYDRLQSEFEVVLKISSEDTKKKMDKALGRNQTMEMVQ